MPSSSSNLAKPRDASAALDYLLLSPDEKINYRTSQGISIQQWYNSFQADHIKEERISKEEVFEKLNITQIPYYRLVKEGLLGKPTPPQGSFKSYVESKYVNALLNQHAKLVPLESFRKLVREKKWYMKEETFERSFRFFGTQSKINKITKYYSILEAAKIISLMKRRKDLIEKGKSLEDLNRESGWNLPAHVYYPIYRAMIRKGEMHGELVPIFKANGEFDRGMAFRIYPEAYKLILERESAEAKIVKEGVTVPQLAKMMGIGIHRATKMFECGELLGLLTVNIVNRGVGRSYNRKVIPLNEARKIVSGKLRFPDPNVIRTKKSQLSDEEYQVQIKAERKLALNSHKVLRTKDIAQRLGIDRVSLTKKLTAAIQNGIVKPYVPRNIRFKAGMILLHERQVRDIEEGRVVLPTISEIKRYALNIKVREAARVQELNKEKIRHEDTPSTDSYSLKSILKNLSALDPKLTPEQRMEIEKRASNGDVEAAKVLYHSNYRLAFYWAKRFEKTGQKVGVEITDLLSASLSGLEEGIEKFDQSKGKLSTYVSWYIQGSIYKTLHTMRSGITTSKNTKLSQVRVESLDTPFDEDENREFNLESLLSHQTYLDSEEKSPHNEYLDKAKEFIASLPEREREVLFLFFGLNGRESMTLEEIGEKFNVTGSRIRQIKDKVLAKLRDNISRDSKQFKYEFPFQN